jgi:hypothetical protein
MADKSDFYWADGRWILRLPDLALKNGDSISFTWTIGPDGKPVMVAPESRQLEVEDEDDG